MSKWIKALKPGTLVSGKFIKAGDIVQLGKGDVFTDTWMEEHEPAASKPLSATDAKKEQEDAVREHEKADAVRRGKYSTRSVPRSPEGQKAHDAKVRAEQPLTPKPLNPPVIDRGSRSPDAPGGVHETSANPSRIDENARL